MSRAAVILTLAVAILAAGIFLIWPGLDLAIARVFFHDGHFWADDPLAKAYRALFYWLPSALMALYGIAYVLARAKIRTPAAAFVSGRGLAFLALSFALGPGVLVNLALKDHWHRPRPAQTADFGGGMAFRPFWRPDGACDVNCSFVSGEVSASAWLIAPASLAPPPLRAPAMAAALVITALTALGRLAFGGHYLSDTLFAAIFTILLVQLLYRLIRPGKPEA